MSSAIRQLSDAHLESVHHLMRQDAATDLAIAREVERLLGKPISSTDRAREALVSRYRQSKHYTEWLARWNNREVEMERQVRLQKERFALLTAVLKDSNEQGFDTLSKSIQARLLTMAAEASDEELREAAGDKGWVKGMLTIVQTGLRDRLARQVDTLKKQIAEMMAPKKGRTATAEDVVAKVDEIMGIQRK